MEKKTPAYKIDATSWQNQCKKPKKYRYLKRDDSDQLVVYRENVDDQKFGKWLNALEDVMYGKYNKRRSVHVENFCGDCNDSLLLVVAKGIKTVVATEVARTSSGSSAGPLQNDGLVFTSNVKVKFPTRKPKLPGKVLSRSRTTNSKGDSSPVKVAVFDTGLIRKEFDDFLTSPAFNPCVGQDNIGWNFTVPNANFNDNHPIAHGSTVSRFIVNEYLKAEGTRPLQIIPVKVHDKNGNSDLYSVLCGLIYAQKQGANIINASFGFYAPKKDEKKSAEQTSSSKSLKQTGSSVPEPPKALKPEEQIGILGRQGAELLERVIKKHLIPNGVLLVAAAGNSASRAELKNKFGITKPPRNERDLGQLDFYPASFSATFPNVIAVTTVNPEASEVSSEQNFSEKIVNIGVRSDIVRGFGFRDPRFEKRFLKGSSYAAPIVTGLLAANFSEFKEPLDKSEIIETLLKTGKLEKKSDLKRQIREGVVISKRI